MKGMTRTLALMATVALLLVAAPNLYAQMRGGGGGQRGSQGMGTPGGGRQGQMGGQQGSMGGQGQMGGPRDGMGGRGQMGQGGMGSGDMDRRMEAPMERASRMRSENAQCANRELNDHLQMATRLNTNADELRTGYQTALANNPSLKFGQYVAATRLAANLGDTNPNITREAILAGLAEGKSIGQTLQSLGFTKHEAQEAKKRAEREIKEARRS